MAHSSNYRGESQEVASATVTSIWSGGINRARRNLGSHMGVPQNKGPPQRCCFACDQTTQRAYSKQEFAAPRSGSCNPQLSYQSAGTMDPQNALTQKGARISAQESLQDCLFLVGTPTTFEGMRKEMAFIHLSSLTFGRLSRQPRVSMKNGMTGRHS